MHIQEIQKKIDETDYWDAYILDFQISYFGDEVSLYIYNDEKSCWRLRFITCDSVQYETDAKSRKIAEVKTMKMSQLGYYGQNINVSKSDIEGFYRIMLDLFIMDITIVCKKIDIQKVDNLSLDFFWKKNTSC